MTILRNLCACCLATLIVGTPLSGWADAGHDHGEVPAASAGSDAPRFAAVSETFELVGVLNGKLLTLYLDRANDNSPVKDAKLELELAGVKVEVKSRGEGEFETTLAEKLKPGLTAVTATVVAGKETDLLAGELDIREGVQTDAFPGSLLWKKYGIWLIAGVLALALFIGSLRYFRSGRINRMRGTA